MSRPSFNYLSQSNVSNFLAFSATQFSTVLTVTDRLFGAKTPSSTSSSPSSLASARSFVLTFCPNVINYVRTNGLIDRKMACVRTLGLISHLVINRCTHSVMRRGLEVFIRQDRFRFYAVFNCQSVLGLGFSWLLWLLEARRVLLSRTGVLTLHVGSTLPGEISTTWAGGGVPLSPTLECCCCSAHSSLQR